MMMDGYRLRAGENRSYAQASPIIALSLDVDHDLHHVLFTRMISFHSPALPPPRDQWYNAVRRSTATAWNAKRPADWPGVVVWRVICDCSTICWIAAEQSGGLRYDRTLSRSMAAVSLAVAAVAMVSRPALPTTPMAASGLSAETVLLPSPLS